VNYVNPPYVGTLLRPKALLAGLLLVVAIAAIALAAPSGASAASGGISAGGDTSRDSGGSNNRTSNKYNRIWDRTSRRQKRWARSTSECESGRDPKAIGGGGRYRGAFQFMKATWRSSPKSPGGDPIKYTYRTQAVVAVALKKRDGAGHWPVCG
jgi:hypothetical protein